MYVVSGCFAPTECGMKPRKWENPCRYLILSEKFHMSTMTINVDFLVFVFHFGGFLATANASATAVTDSVLDAN